MQIFWKSGFRSGAKSIGFYGDFFFLGFWILAVWMPRKYSRLKLKEVKERERERERESESAAIIYPEKVITKI